MKTRLLQALALERVEQTTAAFAMMESALDLCRREGLVRTLVDEGVPMGLLVRKVFDRARQRAKTPDQEAHVIWMQRLLQDFGHLPQEAEAPRGMLEAYLAAPLTQKELITLRLLEEGYSNKSIVNKLLVADSTVRTHLRGSTASSASIAGCKPSQRLAHRGFSADGHHRKP